MKKLDIVFLSTLVTFFIFITLIYSTSHGSQLIRITQVHSSGVSSTVSQQDAFFR